MPREQEALAERLRAVPADFRAAIVALDDASLHRRPAAGEWSAIETLGHIIDKMEAWSVRAERIASEERPLLPDYDQDVYVRERGYQERPLQELLDKLTRASNHFADVVERLPADALDREGVHEVTGPITLRQCILGPLDSLPGHMAQLRSAANAGG
jgi:uncharacterized damage-inducible protein DinB